MKPANLENLINFIENQKLAPPTHGKNNVGRLLGDVLEAIQRKMLKAEQSDLKYAKRRKK